MKVTLLGATHEVTGSMTYIDKDNVERTPGSAPRNLGLPGPLHGVSH